MAGSPFIDPRLVECIGGVPPVVVEAIDDEVREALVQTVGPVLGAAVAPEEVAVSVAPWAFDLGRGLHWYDRKGSSARTAQLVDALVPRLDDPDLVERLCREVDVAWAVIHGRYTDQVFGSGAVHQPSDRLRNRCPWFDAALVGFRVDLVLEHARLVPTAP